MAKMKNVVIGMDLEYAMCLFGRSFNISCIVTKYCGKMNEEMRMAVA